MSIYIKNLEMPTAYPLTVTIYPDGQVLSETVGAKDKHGFAVHVPPHGRLKDYDSIIERYSKWFYNTENREYENMFYMLQNELRGASIVISADLVKKE